MADDIGWEAVTLKGELAHRASLISISLSGQPSLCDNARRPPPRIPVILLAGFIKGLADL
jgi:hypothetical protein